RNPVGGVSWLWRPNDIVNRSGEDTPVAGGAFGSGGQATTGGAAGAAEQEAPIAGTRGGRRGGAECSSHGTHAEKLAAVALACCPQRLKEVFSFENL